MESFLEKKMQGKQQCGHPTEMLTYLCHFTAIALIRHRVNSHDKRTAHGQSD